MALVIGVTAVYKDDDVTSNAVSNPSDSRVSTHITVKKERSEGYYIINYAGVFKTIPAVVITQNNKGKFEDPNGLDNAIVVNTDSTSAVVKTSDNGGKGKWRSFDVLLVGLPAPQ